MRERSGWRLAPAGMEYLELLGEWIDADPDHAGRVSAVDWLAPEKGVQNLLGMDREGALLFLRCSNAMRLDIQFAPKSEFRTARALLCGLPSLADTLRKQGYREIIFESRSFPLIKALERIGFRKTSTEHVMQL